MLNFDTSDRLMVATTALGPDILLFRRLVGEEKISQCFRFELELLADAEGPEIDHDALLGTEATVMIKDEMAINQPRYVSGVVDEVSARDVGGLGMYTLTLVPWLWFLSKSSDNRIFQFKTAPDIIEEVFKDHGFADYRLALKGNFVKRDYCVQFGETDLAFVQRLMEYEGIFYFFEYEEGKHTLIMTDDMAKLKAASGAEKLRFDPDYSLIIRSDTNFITRFERRDRAVTGKFAQMDYDFTKPSANLMAPKAAPRKNKMGDLELYEYPGAYVDQAPGDTTSKIRLEAAQARATECNATSTAPAPAVGNVFELTGFPRKADNVKYLIIGARYEMADGQYYSQATMEGLDAGFTVDYDLTPKSIPFRPERRTPRPVMKGLQTAVVTGPGGEEIYTDEYSRVKVQFFWDREGQKNENTTCWVRVASVWAGSGWGFIQIPRIGQEVIVDFLDGDPDQPIITGRVYNAEQMPPYELPANKTRSGWKSDSSLGSGGWNELMFEDLKGSELVYFQAEKDHDELIKNNETRHIGNDFEEDVVRNARQWVGGWRNETVDLDKTILIKQNRSLTVNMNENIRIKQNSTEKIDMNHTQIVGFNQSIVVKMNRFDKVSINEIRAIGAIQQLTVGADRIVTVNNNQVRQVKGDDQTIVSKNQMLTVGESQIVQIGESQIVNVGKQGTYTFGEELGIATGKSAALNAADDILIEAGKSITLKCGKAEIIMKKDGTISIDGKDISVDGSGKIGVKASKDVAIKGANVKHN